MDNNTFKKMAKEALPLIEQLTELVEKYSESPSGNIRVVVSPDGYFNLESYELRSEFTRLSKEDKPYFHLYEEMDDVGNI